MKKLRRTIGIYLLIIIVLLQSFGGRLAWAGSDPEEEIRYANEFLSAKKQIDFLGDGEANPDTKLSGDEFYRLYLDVKGTSIYSAMDVVLVLDYSASMGTYNLGNEKRISALNKVLKGGYRKRGIIDEIYALNNKNRISIKAFNGWAKSISSWVDKSGAEQLKSSIPTSTPSKWDSYNGGTNTEYGLHLAQEQLNDPNGKDNGNQKVVILLSDGEPTHFMTPNPLQMFNTNTFEGKTGYRRGDGSSKWLNLNLCKQPTINAATIFKKNNPTADLYSIFVADKGGYRSNQGLMEKIATVPEYAFGAENVDELIDSFRKSLGIMENVTISDELSQYVDLYRLQPDIKVTKKDENGKLSTLAPSEYQLIQPNPTNPKKISATIKGGLEINSTYTLSFNVQITQQARDSVVPDKTGIEYYGKDGVLGDYNTDYLTNITSSHQPGLRSNKEATVTWQRKERPNNQLVKYQYTYDHPVVQVPAEEIVADAVASQHKSIDYLNDGMPNPDTQLTGKYSYRLYLDGISSIEGLVADKFTPLTQVVIEDKLSKYVDYHPTQPDPKVTQTVNGVTTDIPTSQYEYFYDVIARTIRVKFHESMPLNSKYTVSFNVEVSNAAKNEYTLNQVLGNDLYNNTIGDVDTDYPLNTTSSNKSGFHSNELAIFSWKVGDMNYQEEYQHPVVQVDTE